MNEEKYISLVSLKVVREKEISYDPISIKDPYTAIKAVKQIIGEADREYFLVLSLDTQNRINAIEICSIGSLSGSLVHPREVFKHAILANVSRIMLVHNHPSGEIQPSLEDVTVTHKLKAAGELLGIKVIDHLILGTDDFFSFAKEGMI